MPPTLKDSSTLSTSPENPERSSENSSAPQASGSDKAIALEVPVTVNGARPLEGSEKREPFSETTRTVLVLPGGAVIRLASSVAPGQLLFLTNEKTKKEVVCQVVKSKSYPSASGYVELEFTEPVLGFWGMRFPSDRHTTQSAPQPAPRKLGSDSTGAGITPKSTEEKPSSYADASPAASDVTSNLADAVEEFKTEIKADARPLSKADLMAPAEPSVDGLKFEASRLQEQLSEPLFAEQKQNESKSAAPAASPSTPALGDAAAKIFEMASDEPAADKNKRLPTLTAGSPSPAAPKNVPAESKSSFDDEQMEIPAWLEPLARNAAISAPVAENSPSESPVPAEERKSETAPESSASQKHAPAQSAPAARQTHAAPLFGNTLLTETAPRLKSARGGNKMPWMAVAAGLVFAVAAGGWYFRDSIAPIVSGHGSSESNASRASSAGSTENPAVPEVSSSGAATPSSTSSPKAEPADSLTKASGTNIGPEAAAIASTGQGKVQPAAITERIPKAGSANDSNFTDAVESVEPEIKRPSLGKVRLAKPKIGHGAKATVNGEMEPALDLSSDALTANGSSLDAKLGESASQPAAPAAPALVGGDVKPAHLISSVPPVYPAMAKTEHVSGDVRIDALIDPNGRVTTMKVVSGPPLLHQAARDALRQWKYQPAMLDGNAVPMHLTVTIQFRLQ